jgi:hypothetical protein
MLEDAYRLAEKRAARVPVLSDRAAKHVARLGLSRRQLAAAVGVSVGEAQRLSTPGNGIARELERRVLELR